MALNNNRRHSQLFTGRSGILIVTAALLFSSLTIFETQAADRCAQKPKSSFGGFLKGTLDRVSRRVTGTGIVGDLLIESRKLLSDTIACALTEVENKQAIESQRRALESGKTGKASRQTWTSGDRKGVSGGTEVVSRRVMNGQQCAVKRTFITDVDGVEKEVNREVCDQGGGVWVDV